MTKSMKEKFRAYCEYEIDNVTKREYNANDAATRCYGAVMFLLNQYGWDDELSKMWDNEIHPKFRELGAC